MHRPLIAVTASVDEKDSRARRAYTDAVLRCGGLPVVLPVPGLGEDADEIAREYAKRFTGFLFTGGDDPRTEAYGQPTHPSAKTVAPERQRFEEALLRALDADAAMPVLGVCLGMQMMSLHAGGMLNQHLPDDTPTHADHTKDNAHPVFPAPVAEGHSKPTIRLPAEGVPVASWHHQAVLDPGRLKVLARAHDGVIEAVTDPRRWFYLGVQWHPERTADPRGGDDVIRALVNAAAMVPPS